VRAGGEAKIILMATPTHGNLGDQAIVFAEKQIIERLGYKGQIVEINNTEYLWYADFLQRKITNKDVIIIDGGGNLGILWENVDDKISDIISRFSKNKIVIFPQTCYYGGGNFSAKRLEKNNVIYKNAKDLTIYFRDRVSFDFANANFVGAKLVFAPDIVLSVAGVQKQPNKHGVLLCFRQDKEKVIGVEIENTVRKYLTEENISFVETTTVIQKRITCINRKEELTKKWYEFSRSALVITDRLHAMIFSAIMHTPCIAFDNESKKVSGSYEWISGLSYLCIAKDADDVLEKIPEYYNKPALESFSYPNMMEQEVKSWCKQWENL
jgi:pyruvyl transferase EpsI